MPKKTVSAPELPEDDLMKSHAEALTENKLESRSSPVNEAVEAVNEQLESTPEDIADDEAVAEVEALEEATEPNDDESNNLLKSEDSAIDADKLAEEESDAKTEDTVTDDVVDDIVASDAAKDTDDDTGDTKEAHEDVPFAPLKKRHRLQAWLKGLWDNPRSRWAILGGTAGVVLLVTLIPHSRYFVLNTAGVRSSLSLTVVDSGTNQPLKNVQVNVGGSSGQTDSKGKITLKSVRLGRNKLSIEKRAFATVNRTITVGWGSNPLGNFSVTAVGTQYSFTVTDFLSGKPIADAEATSGEGNAHADKDGKIILTLDTGDKADSDQVTVTISAAKYRSENINLTVNNKEAQALKMVPSRKHVFVSKRSGKYDVYSIDVDGKNERKIVAGTGLERDDLVLVPHQSDETAALVSTRENVRNGSGYLLSTLYIIDTESGDLVKIDQSEQIQVIGWSADQHLIYVKIAAGSSGANPKRHRLMSFNGKNVADVKELASSNSFNDVMMANDKVFYAPSNAFQDNPDAALYSVNPDGSSQQKLVDKEIYNIFRADYETLVFSAGEEWYNYKLGSATAVSVQAPSNQTNRLYTDNASNSNTLWVDDRDGKGVLLNYDKTAKKETTLLSRGGLKTPVYWLSPNYAVFRVNDGKETADYVLNIDGGEAHKITDVTDTSGIDRWYYY